VERVGGVEEVIKGKRHRPSKGKALGREKRGKLMTTTTRSAVSFPREVDPCRAEVQGVGGEIVWPYKAHAEP